jgi:hypothetical protein
MISLFAVENDSLNSEKKNLLVNSVRSYPNLKIVFIENNKLETNNFALDRLVLSRFLDEGENFAVILKKIPQDPTATFEQLLSFDSNESIDLIDLIQLGELKQNMFLDRNRFRLTSDYRHVLLAWILDSRIIKIGDFVVDLFCLGKLSSIQNLRTRKLRVLERSQADLDFGRKNFSGSLFIPGQIEENCTQYLISRKCAESIVKFNSEQLLSSDMVLLGVSRAGNFRTGRIY